MPSDPADELLNSILAAPEEARAALFTSLRSNLNEEFLNTLGKRIGEAFERKETPRIHLLLDACLSVGKYLNRADVLYNACLWKGFALAGTDDDEALEWFKKAQDKALIIKPDEVPPFDINSLSGMAIRNIATLMHRQGMDKLTSGDNNGAISFLSSAIDHAEQLISQPGIEHSYKFLAYALEYAGRNEEALEYYGKAIERFDAVGNKPDTATTLMNQAGCLKTVGRNGDAVSSLERAVDIFSDFGDKAMATEASVAMADIYFTRLGDYDKALEHLAKVIGSGFREQEATALMQMAGIYLDRGTYSLMLKTLERMVSLLTPPASDMESSLLVDAYTDMAEAHFLLRNFDKVGIVEREATDLARSIGYRTGNMRLYESMGNRSYNLGRFEEALRHYEEAMEIARDPEDITTRLRLLRGKGSVFLSLHCREDALNAYNESITLARKYHLNGDEIEALSALGYCEGQAGNYDEALRRYDEAINLCGSMEEHALAAVSCRKDKAGILAAQGKTSEALNLLVKVRDIHHTGGFKRHEVYDCMELGAIAHKSKDFARARRFYSEALELCNEPGMTDEKVNCLHGQAFAYGTEEEYDHALECLNFAWELLDPSKDGFLVFATQYALGIINKKKGTIEKAAEHYVTAWKYAEHMRQASSSEELRIQWMDDKKTLIDETVAVLVQLGRNEDAFYYLETAKSRVLAELLGLSKLRKPAEIGMELSTTEDDLLAQARSIQEKMGNSRGGEGQFAYGPSLAAVSAALNDVWKEMDLMYHDSPEVKAYLALRRGDAVTAIEARDLISAIPGTTAIVEYFTHRERLYIFVLRSDTKEVKVVEAGRSEKEIQTLIESGIVDGQVHMSALSMWQANLARDLVDPLVESLEGCDLVYLVPYGDIVRLPLHAFKTSAGFRLIEKYVIAYTSATSVLKFSLGGSSSDSAGSLVMAFEGRPPQAVLTQVYPEANAVRTVLGKGDICLGDHATVGNLINKGKDKRIIHLACHGEFNAHDPMKSCLHLFDGPLTADEIFRHVELKANLITLSACQTGRVSLRPGDETFGLVRAFMHAGVSSLVVSLWNLNDETSSQFMDEFYRKCAKMTVGKALAETQREALGRPMSHPYFWAPFILIGNYR
jgi:CHAT domain-containing protein/tetratricopeptide (TPR) repeat protein